MRFFGLPFLFCVPLLSGFFLHHGFELRFGITSEITLVGDQLRGEVYSEIPE